MLVPGHVVSLYVATSGLKGTGLGSDEKEVILLVYVIIDVSTNKIVGVQQYLVRPVYQIGNGNNVIIGNANTCNKDRPALTAPPPSQSPNTLSDMTVATINSTQLTTTSTVGSQAAGSLVNTVATQQHVTTVDNCDESELNPDVPITETLLQVAGKSLAEVIEQFDAYVRSLQIDPQSTNFRLITDGQLPIRQCLHPETSAKDIKLPSYYWRFSDLRKEYQRFKLGDLSRALIPVKDVQKLPNMPSLPNSIGDIIKELELQSYNETDFYIKESRDMVTVIQSLLAAGHKFEANETVNLALEPGICSIDDEIDGSCIVRARGLPWQSSDQDIAKFFRGLNVAKGGVALCLSPQGRRNGEALVRFVSQEHRDMALKRHKHHIGNRYIEVYRASGEDFIAVAGGASNEAQAFLSKGAQVIIRMRGLPYDCTAKQILDFFSVGESPCNVLDGNDGVLFVKKPDGRATGDAFVLFASEQDAPKALSRHRESIGQRYIELFSSTPAEVQQILNRSMDPKTYEPPAPPLIAQLPPVSMPLLPQHVITSGTTKDCIRLRGLPYEAKVEHILHFLEDFAQHIVYQGVHMVYNPQGQPSGEAFIQMNSEASAYASAQQKHNKYMVFGKKHRYIEVFQCSGDDMNLVLTGGLHPPANPSKQPLLSPGVPPFAGYSPFAPPTAVLPPPRGHHPAFYPQPILYWGYPSPPVSPTTYYGPPTHQPPHQHPQHLAPNLAPQPHQPTLLPVDYVAATTSNRSGGGGGGIPATVAGLMQQSASVTVTASASTTGSNNGQHLMPPLSPLGSHIYHQTVQPTVPPQSHYHQFTHIPHAAAAAGYSSPVNHHQSLSHQPLQPPTYHPDDTLGTAIIPRVLTPINIGPIVAPNQYVELFIV